MTPPDTHYASCSLASRQFVTCDTSRSSSDFHVCFIFKSAESLTYQHHMFSWPKMKRRVRCEHESWASALSDPQPAFLDLGGPRITREEELEFLLAEAKKEVRETRNMIEPPPKP